METNEEVLLDGERVELPRKITPEDMDDVILLEEEEPTEDLSGMFESTQEIDWSQNE